MQSPSTSSAASDAACEIRRPRRRARGGSRGLSLIDALFATIVLVVAALGGLSSVCASHQVNRSTEDYAVAAETLGRFVERLRADPDWVGQYARLCALSAESTGDVSLSRLDVDTKLPTYPASTYYADFTAPKSLGTATFLVQVPSTTIAGVPALRETAVAPRYALPYDLNGDGLMDDKSRIVDYAVLPMVVRIRWQHPPHAPDELVLPTWLKGER
jgi:hypothetical protein